MDEEDEVSDEEEDEKFDIDDLSSAESPTKLSPKDAERGQEKMQEQAQERAENAARLLAQGNPELLSSEGQAPSSGLKSGVDTPDRFVIPPPHPPRVSPRHVQFLTLSNSSSTSSIDTLAHHPRGEHGERDDIRGPHSAHYSTRVRIPKDRDLDAESLKTPTPVDPPVHRRRVHSRGRSSRSRSRSRDGTQRRAFAVRGQDESDSAASDSDADP